jgi:hypothetical protein
MPSHPEDLHIIPTILTTITHQINHHLQSNIILCGNFNRDLSLTGCILNDITKPPHPLDYQWQLFTRNLGLQYIPIDTTYTRQGGPNYTHSSLIDGYFIKTTHNPSYTSHTNINFPQNSDHFLVSLHIPQNTLLARPPLPPQASTNRILNPIPQTNLDNFNISFFSTHSLLIENLTHLLKSHEILSNHQWQEACHALDNIINQISLTIQTTCSAPLLPTLTHTTNRLGGFLPRKPQKTWKKLIATHHLIRKIINIVKNNPQWHLHPILQTLSNHPHIQLPPPPIPPTPPTAWLKEIATIGKNAEKDARTIITKHNRKSIQKAISKFQHLINTKPKQGNKAIFRNSDSPPPDSIVDQNNNILTHPSDIATEIFVQQSQLNAPTVTNCPNTNNHPPNCTCKVHQYPWHDINGFVLDKRGNANLTISSLFIREMYDLCVKHLSKKKILGPNQISNSIIKNIPENFHTMLFLFFSHCYKQKVIPQSWKTSNTILLYKKGNSSILTNHRPIALANKIYKLFTSTLTTLLSAYGEKYQILHTSQEGFRQERSIPRTIQTLIVALEDARLTSQDIYILYIDFTNAFGSIDHAHLLVLMTDLGYPQDVVNLIGNIYYNSHTTYIGEYFGKIQPIPIKRGTIQGDTLSPYPFIIFLEPLLRWLDRDNLGYTFRTSSNSISSAAYADDLATLFGDIKSIPHQVTKIDKFCNWAGMNLGINKCAITCCPNHSSLSPITFKALIQSHNICFQNQPIPVLHQNESYKYLGIQLVPSLTWTIQIHTTMSKLK